MLSTVNTAMCALLVSISASAQSLSVLDSHPAISGAPVFDERHQRAIWVAGEQRWEWRDRWRLDPVSTSAPIAIDMAVYDGHRGVTYSLDAQMQVNEWNGLSHHTYVGGSRPPVRFGALLAFDIARHRLVMLGGFTQQILGTSLIIKTPLADTWEWDGQSWTPRPGPSPPARCGAVMAYDSLLGKCVLLDGSNHPGTWLYDGAWQLAASVPPAAEISSTAVFDPALGAVVVAGEGALHTFDGTGWQSHAGPPANEALKLVPAGSGELLAVGAGSTWHRKSGVWSEVFQTVFGELAWDTARGELLAYDGRDALRWRDGWTVANDSPRPIDRLRTKVAFDEQRGELVLFGGFRLWTILSDTWTLDGNTWTHRLPQHSPPARQLHAMTFDAERQEVVLFGGRIASPLSDTWTWDGVDWTEHVTGVAPPGRSHGRLAFDRQRCVSVLAGGRDSAGLHVADTWEWDGTTWTQRAATGGPGGPLLYDTSLQRVVAYPSGSAPVTWSGTEWEPYPGMVPLGPSSGHVAFDPVRSRVVWAAGALQTLGPTPATAETYGAGCGTVPPVLQVNSLPAAGNTAFELALATHHASSPSILMIGLPPAQTPFGGGCTVLVSDPMLLPGTAGAGGFADFALPLPNNLGLRGLTVHVQGMALQVGSPLGYALSQGLSVTIGD